MYLSVVLPLFFVLGIVLMTYDKARIGSYDYLLGLSLTIISISYILNRSSQLFEHLQMSGEAVQNVGSIYNQNKMVLKDLDVTGTLKVSGPANVSGPLNVGSWTIKDAGEIQFVKNGGGYAVFQPDGNMWTQPTGSYRDNVGNINALIGWKNALGSGQGPKSNGDRGKGWNAKDCAPSTSGGCVDSCPAGYYMTGLSAGKDWDHKHPVCTKFT
jgi:hypothetical protein